MAETFPRDKVCIVGIGETEYTKWGQITRPEFQLALEAILKAVEDAGLHPHDIDGFASYSDDRNQAALIATALGSPRMRWSSMHWGGGGGGGSGSLHQALAALATGSATYVVCWRGLAQGQFGRFGGAIGGGIPRVPGAMGYLAPFGVMTPAGLIAAMRARRHMHEFGTQSRHFGAISVACYKHAQRNPRAVMYGKPLTLEDHQNSRWIIEPLHLPDCCLENDGGAAAVLTTAERAKDLKQKPVYIMGAGHGSGPMGYALNSPEWLSANFRGVAQDLWERAGVTPKDIDVMQVYENFTPMTLMSIEDHGFCKVGEGGSFVEGGRIEWPDGKIPLNTSGGNVAECYMHGFELITEAVRQMRGASTCQVEGAEIGLVASGPGVTPVSDMVVRR